MNLLFIGDVVGKPGRRILSSRLGDLQRRFAADFTIVNCENASGGRGVSPSQADEMLSLGVDVLTSGNHIWAHRDVSDYLEREPRLLRPLNYPPGAPGEGVFHGRSRSGHAVVVVNLQGRVFMPDIDCPFRALDGVLEELSEDGQRIVLVDFHAEATSEKMAMGWYADGRVSAVLGTHTHVPTADARVLPGGTAFCTDVGMTGPYDSVIGTRQDLALERFLSARPVRFQVAKSNPRVAGAVVDVDPADGRATRIRTFVDPPEDGRGDFEGESGEHGGAARGEEGPYAEGERGTVGDGDED